MASVDERDTAHLRRAMALARKSRERGDDPFGAVLVDKDGRVLAEGLNTETTGRDVTGHAETSDRARRDQPDPRRLPVCRRRDFRLFLAVRQR